MPKSIVDWFNINDPQHIAAYRHVCDKGYWPQDFLPNRKAVGFPAGWPNLLAGKIAEALLTQREGMREVLTLVEQTFNASVRSSDKESHYVAVTRFTALTLIGQIRALLDPFRKAEQR